MTSKDVDMGFTVDEVAAGIARLLDKRGTPAEAVRHGDTVRFQPSADIVLEVSPMPEERIRYPILFPRTLLVLRGPDDEIGRLEREVWMAFLRVTG